LGCPCIIKKKVGKNEKARFYLVCGAGKLSGLWNTAFCKLWFGEQMLFVQSEKMKTASVKERDCEIYEKKF